jgi:hypothetical protein
MARPEAQIGGKFALMSPPDTGGIPSSTGCPSFTQSFAAASVAALHSGSRDSPESRFVAKAMRSFFGFSFGDGKI